MYDSPAKVLNSPPLPALLLLFLQMEPSGKTPTFDKFAYASKEYFDAPKWNFGRFAAYCDTLPGFPTEKWSRLKLVEELWMHHLGNVVSSKDEDQNRREKAVELLTVSIVPPYWVYLSEYSRVITSFEPVSCLPLVLYLIVDPPEGVLRGLISAPAWLPPTSAGSFQPSHPCWVFQ